MARPLRLVPLLAALFLLPSIAFTLGPLSPRWHLQRIAQRTPLSTAQFDTSARSPLPQPGPDATRVNIYVIDSGVRVSHEEFAGRASPGADFVDRDGQAADCQGHGTNVASLAAGRYSGVARSARVIAVRILRCDGTGYCADVIRALEWVAADAARRRPARAVVVLSLGSRDRRCGPTVARTDRLAARGVVVVAAAGNSRNDSCAVYPARNRATIAVGATDRRDRPYEFNNHGACVDILAPGVRVVAAWGGRSDREYRAATGTSMATPLVAGAAALIMAADPSLGADEVRDVLLTGATPGVVRDHSGKRTVSKKGNRLLFAPWAELFEEVPRDAHVARFGARGGSWSAVNVGLRPRARPAMAYSTVRLRAALADACGVEKESVVVRRAEGVRRHANGSEPGVVWLRAYVRAGANGTGVARKLEGAVRSGEVGRRCGESIMFRGSRQFGFVEGGAVMPAAVYDRKGRKSGLEMDSVSIILLVVSCWILSMIAIFFATCAWKRKWKHVPADGEDGETSEEVSSMKTECPQVPEVVLDVNPESGEVQVRLSEGG